jgi:hypothetical protein
MADGMGDLGGTVDLNTGRAVRGVGLAGDWM